MTAAQPASLRFGVMCSGTVFDAWQARCIEALLAVEGVAPGLLIVDARPRPSRRPLDRITRLARAETMAWKTFNDGFVSRRSAALRKVDLTPSLADVPRIDCTVTKRGKFSEIFDAADVAAIRDHDLDFLLRFAFGIVRGDVLTAARYGIWSFHHDDEAVYRGGPPCFWELYDRDPVSGVMLQRLTERLDSGVVLHKGFVRTAASSYTRNTDAVHFAGAAFPAKICRDILAGRDDHVTAAPTESNAPIRHNPTNRQMARFLTQQARAFVAAQVQSSLRRDEWNVGVVDTTIDHFVDPAFEPTVRWAPRTAGREIYVADPFGPGPGGPGGPGGLERDSILVEAFDQRTQLGVIRAFDVGTGRLGARAVLPDEVHLSFPYLVWHDGQLYCVPEAARARAVRLFRARRFPDEWDDLGVLVGGVAAVDPTVFEYDGRWWLFFTDRDVDSNAVLHVWHAPDLLGPWSPHAANPVKTDVRSSRPAGTPFVHEGRLYRPAQDCSETYGGAVAVNEVEELTPDRFRERVVRVVRPDPTSPLPAGRHTLSALGTRTLIDGKRRAFRGRSAVTAIVGKARRGFAKSH